MALLEELFWKKGSGSGGGPGSAYHSRQYHTFFEGYAEVREETANGRGKILRIYAAPWYVCSQTAGQWLRRKLLYVFFTFAAMCLFLSGSVRATGVNLAWYTQICTALTVISFLPTLYHTICILFFPRKMTVGQYKIISVKYAAALKRNAACICAGIAAQIIYLVRNSADAASALIDCGLFLAAVCLLCLIRRIETGTKYMQLKNEQCIPRNGIEI